MTTPALNHVMNQVRSSKTELAKYAPRSIDWIARANSTCKRLVPFLESHSGALAEYLVAVMNSPNDVRESVGAILEQISDDSSLRRKPKFREVVKRLRKSLDLEQLLISDAGGTAVSKLIEKFLITQATEWSLESNGASDYPDLFFRCNDYGSLPPFQRGANQVYGAARKGKSMRPVRVPDGLEIKTCKGPFAVDCHHAHAGLHLVVLFNKTRKQFRVDDIQVAFMRQSFYRITKPASPTTTLKASFNGKQFVSILSDLK